MQPTLKITIGASAEIKVEVVGDQGSGCVKLTEPLKAHGTVTDFQTKPEFHGQTQATVGVSLQQEV